MQNHASHLSWHFPKQTAFITPAIFLLNFHAYSSGVDMGLVMHANGKHTCSKCCRVTADLRVFSMFIPIFNIELIHISFRNRSVISFQLRCCIFFFRFCWWNWNRILPARTLDCAHIGSRTIAVNHWQSRYIHRFAANFLVYKQFGHHHFETIHLINYHSAIAVCIQRILWFELE